MHQAVIDSSLLGAASLVALVAAVFDWRDRRIPNWLVGRAMLTALVFHAMGGWRALIGCLLAGLLAGGIAFMFYRAKGMGAGDVKLLAAIGCWAGLHALPILLIATALAGAAFAIGVAIHHQHLRHVLPNLVKLVRHHRHEGLTPNRHLNIKATNALSIPFALPIACGCLFALCVQIWSVSR